MSIDPSSRISDIEIPPSWIGKILKVPVFRLALQDDLVSRILIAVHNFFASFCGDSFGFRNFDPKRAEQSVQRFQALGAKVHFVTPRDGKGKIQMMTFSAQDLEKTIQDHGGKWEKVTLNGREVLAISGPMNDPKWLECKEKLSHFRWREEDGYLITSETPNLIREESPEKLFVYAHSTSISFSSDWERAGFYLGTKKAKICFFDNGNTWKNQGRDVSERSFYLEAEAVYEKAKEGFAPENIWVGGGCGGAPVAAYLKMRYHQEGVNFFVEQSFADLNDFVKPIAPQFAPWVKGSLNPKKDPFENLTDAPRGYEFSVSKMWKDLTPISRAMKGGQLIFIEVSKDEHISKEAYVRYVALAEKVQGAERVKHILFSSNAKSRHADNFYRTEQAGREFVKTVFQF